MEGSKSITPYFVEESLEISFGSKSLERRQLADEYEYDDDYDRIDNGLGDDYDFDQPLQPLIPLKYTNTLSSSFTEAIPYSERDEDDEEEVDDDDDDNDMDSNHDEQVDGGEQEQARSDVANSSSDKAEPALVVVGVEDTEKMRLLSEDLLELFFNTFLDSELEGEITICQWIQALGELCVDDMTEKDMYRVFNHISCDGCYVDAVDFAKFCQRKMDDNDANCEIQKLRDTLNNAILRHPFVIS